MRPLSKQAELSLILVCFLGNPIFAANDKDFTNCQALIAKIYRTSVEVTALKHVVRENIGGSFGGDPSLVKTARQQMAEKRLLLKAMIEDGGEAAERSVIQLALDPNELFALKGEAIYLLQHIKHKKDEAISAALSYLQTPIELEEERVEKIAFTSGEGVQESRPIPFSGHKSLIKYLEAESKSLVAETSNVLESSLALFHDVKSSSPNYQELKSVFRHILYLREKGSEHGETWLRAAVSSLTKANDVLMAELLREFRLDPTISRNLKYLLMSESGEFFERSRLPTRAERIVRICSRLFY